MTALLIAARAVLSVLIVVFVGLAFLPHVTAEWLTALQKDLTEMIEHRRRSDRGRK